MLPTTPIRTYLFTLVALGACSTGPAADSAGPSAAPEIAMFRGGPAHVGVYETEGVEQEPTALWKFKTGGRVLSSPAVIGGRVYFGSDDGALYAVDSQTGEQVWRYQTEGEVRSSPAVVGDLVYFGSYDGGFYALHAESGELVWRFHTTGERRWRAAGLDWMTPADQVHTDPWDFFLSSPVVADGVVYFGTGKGRLYALDGRTGDERWVFETGDTVHSSPAVVDSTVYVGNMESRLYAVDVATGQARWYFQAGVDLDAYNQHGLQSSPAVANGVVYIGGRDGGVHAVDVRTGEALRKFDTKRSWVLGSVAVADDRVYFGTSDTAVLRAVDAASGDNVFDVPVGSCVFSSPALVRQTLYVGTCAGELLAVSSIDGVIRWRFRTDASVEDRHGLLGSDGELNRGKLFEGEYTAETAPAIVERLLDLGSLLSSPVVQDGVLYVGSADGYLYALVSP